MSIPTTASIPTVTAVDSIGKPMAARLGQPPTRKQAVLRQLREEIVAGRLRPGAVLKDAEEAARMGVSITPVREAIVQLAAEGLIDIAPNRSRHVTEITRQNALELIDVMAVLATAGFEWGAENLTGPALPVLRRLYQEFAEHLGRGDVTAARQASAELSTRLTLAGGNRELRTHMDLIIARTLRILALAPDSQVWPVWLDGYREVLDHLEAGRRDAAGARYRQIFTEFRIRVQTAIFDA
jgi:DNA-binding GntR family transcriptional regulator